MPMQLGATAQAVFDEELESMRRRERDHKARSQMWHAHHWPDDTTVAPPSPVDRCAGAV